MGSHGCCCPEDGSLYVLDECLGVLRSGRLEDASPTLVGFNWINDLVCAALGPTTRMIPEEICSVLGPSPAFTSGASYDEFTVRMPLSSTTMNLFLDTAITAMSALMIVMLVPSVLSSDASGICRVHTCRQLRLRACCHELGSYSSPILHLGM